MIATQESISAPPRDLAARLAAAAPAILIAAGLAVRLISAHAKYLNADEAMHYLLSVRSSFGAAYRASLGTAHPPLLILLLHYWGMISNTEFFLRLPSVAGGTASGWFLYAWLRRVTDNTTALIALALLLFSPALIYTSAEVRQYALVLCFMSAALYFLERAFLEDSPGTMALSAAALCLALLTHYCALIFALSAGLYGIIRLGSIHPRRALAGAWVAEQAVAVGIAAVLWRTHLSTIRHAGLIQDVKESYLSGSLLHRGEESMFLFAARANLRVFHFMFSQGAVSILGLLLFVAGIVLMLRTPTSAPRGKQASARQLGLLLLLPFVINCVAALAGVYPYGGTRHNSYLAIFALPAVATALARWKVKSSWIKPVAIALALAICNFTVSPAGAYIQAKNQKKELMDSAVAWVHKSAPQGSIILTDYESGLLLSYYVCHKGIVQTEPPLQLFYRSRCGDYDSISLLPRVWVFHASSFPEQAVALQHVQDQGRQIWLFQAGFIVDHEPEFQALLAQYGCPSPARFGANILVCPISLSPAPGNNLGK